MGPKITGHYKMQSWDPDLCCLLSIKTSISVAVWQASSVHWPRWAETSHKKVFIFIQISKYCRLPRGYTITRKEGQNLWRQQQTPQKITYSVQNNGLFGQLRLIRKVNLIQFTEVGKQQMSTRYLCFLSWQCSLESTKWCTAPLPLQTASPPHAYTGGTWTCFIFGNLIFVFTQLQ